MGEDISSLGSKEVMIERRVLFRMDLPHRKSIGVKAKPNRTVRDVFKPILNKYGFKLDNITVQLVGWTEVGAKRKWKWGMWQLWGETSLLDKMFATLMLRFV